MHSSQDLEAFCKPSSFKVLCGARNDECRHRHPEATPKDLSKFFALSKMTRVLGGIFLIFGLELSVSSSCNNFGYIEDAVDSIAAIANRAN